MNCDDFLGWDYCPHHGWYKYWFIDEDCSDCVYEDYLDYIYWRWDNLGY